MAKEIAGKGRKRPQLNVPVTLLNLDSENPRLAKDGKAATQLDLLDTLYTDFDIEELAFSMAENGYFDEEPIVVVPKTKPKGFALPKDIEQQQTYLQSLINKGEIQLTVVEGNRRTATLKILTDASIRKQVGVSTDFPRASAAALKDLAQIPAIFYENRNEVTPYLGVRHISGSKKWDFYPRVFYVSKRIEEIYERKKDYGAAFEDVQKQVALRRSDTVIKHYFYYRLSKIVESDLDFDVEPVRRNFSLIEVAIRAPGIRRYIGLGDDASFHKKIDFTKRVVPSNKNEELERVLTWIYGNKKKNIQPLFTDSRHIPNLGKILLSEEATDYLIANGDFEGAYDRCDGEKDMLVKRINDARKKLESAMSIAYKHKSKEMVQLVDTVILAAEELKKNF